MRVRGARRKMGIGVGHLKTPNVRRCCMGVRLVHLTPQVFNGLTADIPPQAVGAPADGGEQAFRR